MNWADDGHLQRTPQKILVIIVNVWQPEASNSKQMLRNILKMIWQCVPITWYWICWNPPATCTLGPDGTPSVQPWRSLFGLPLLWITHRCLKRLPIYQCPRSEGIGAPYFYMAAWLPIKKKNLRALRSLFIIGRNVLKSSETIQKNDVLTHFVLAALLLSNCWFFLTHKHILLISVSLTEQWSWVHSILLSNTGYNSRLLWCSSGIPGNCHDGFCPHPILFDIQYSPHY